VRRRVLLRRAELGGRPRRTRRQEHRIVTESAVAAGFTHDAAPPLTTHHHAFGLTGAEDQRARRHERRAPALLGHVAELAEQQRRVCRVVAVPSRPARAEHTGHPVEGVDLESGIVGHGGQARRGERVARLGQRVLFERRTGFRGLVERRHVVERQQRQPRHPRGVEHAAQLVEFLAVAAGDK